MGDWNPRLHASEHFHCAKSTQIYVQDMRDLKNRMDPEEYNTFAKYGYFTTRKTDKFYSDNFSEQTIMKVEGGSFKLKGRL